jgi:hypothetical protein
VPLAATAARAIRKPKPDHATEDIDFPQSRVRAGYEPVDIFALANSWLKSNQKLTML